MTKQKRKISKLLEEVKQALIDDKMMSSTSRALMEEQSQVITELINRLGLNSKNSSKPPSKDGIGDKEGQKKGEKKGSGKKSGGQPGHKGSRLEPVDNPDLIIKLPLDRSTLPEGGTYTTVEPVKKQVFDFEINKIVTEYQAEVVVDEKGKRFVAPFPSGVSQQTQYGPGVKAQVVFDSQKQLIPNMRVAEDMAENVGYPISVGTIHNAIEDAFNRLEPFEACPVSSISCLSDGQPLRSSRYVFQS
jgi:transposase